jgi:hypothetical protein
MATAIQPVQRLNITTSQPVAPNYAGQDPNTTDPSGANNPGTIDSNPGSTSPTAPGFIADYDPSQALLNGYTNYTSQNDAGIQALTQQALNPGQSAWANLADQQQDVQATNQKDVGANSVAGQTAGAMDNLAMQGGLSSGARERAQEGGAKNLMAMDQDVGRQEGLNKLQVGVNDQQNKMQQLSQLPGIEQNQANAWEGVRAGDLQNQINENQAANTYNQNLYQSQMGAWGAAQQASATAASGKK